MVIGYSLAFTNGNGAYIGDLSRFMLHGPRPHQQGDDTQAFVLAPGSRDGPQPRRSPRPST
jgi:ammonia channel protein AmtB